MLTYDKIKSIAESKGFSNFKMTESKGHIDPWVNIYTEFTYINFNKIERSKNEGCLTTSADKIKAWESFEVNYEPTDIHEGYSYVFDLVELKDDTFYINGLHVDPAEEVTFNIDCLFDSSHDMEKALEFVCDKVIEHGPDYTHHREGMESSE